jgi:hypothetical protein
MGDYEGNTVLPSSAPWEERKAERDAFNAYLDDVDSDQPRFCADGDCDMQWAWHTHAGKRAYRKKKNRGAGRYSK